MIHALAASGSEWVLGLAQRVSLARENMFSPQAHRKNRRAGGGIFIGTGTGMGAINRFSPQEKPWRRRVLNSARFLIPQALGIFHGWLIL